MAVRTLSLFSGAGGLDLATRIALPDARTVCYVEGEISACEVLAARIAEGSLDDAPIWSDVRTFDGKPWRGQVDLIVGGFPCQDLSVAGKRIGLEGRRSGLVFEMFRIIEQVQPQAVFVENVPGLVSTLTLLHRSDILGHFDRLRATATTARERWHVESHITRLYRRLLPIYGMSALLYVLCRLEELGYEVAAGKLAASEVGAPHKRERVFVLAHRPQRGHRKLREPSRSDGQSDGSNAFLVHAEHPERRAACGRGDGGFEGADGQGKAAGRAGEPDAAVDHPTSPRPSGRQPEQDTAPRDEARLRESGGRRDELAHASQPGPQERRCEPGDAGQECGATERDRAAVADTQGVGGTRQQPSGTGCRAYAGFAGPSYSLFPPGPADHDAWREVLVRCPWMRPAIAQAEAESLLRGVATGSPDELDFEDRTDRLRGLGNLVVPMQGAAALALLLRELREHMESISQ